MDFDEEMEALRQEFLTLGRERLGEMAAALAALQEDPADAAALGRLRHHLHAFAGVGASYGYPDVTDAARAAEQVCDAHLEGRRPADAGAIAGWQRAADDIAAALARAPAA